MHNSEIVELFPIPVYKTIIPVKLSLVIPFLDNQEMSMNSDEDNYGQRSKNTYILNEPECNGLRNFILEQAKNYANDVLGYDYKEYKFSQSWVSLKYPGQHHTIHTHPNSLISGVFYYGNIKEETPSINFHKSIGGTNASYISPKINSNKSNSKYTCNNYSINCIPGLLILFPSHLLHSVPLNKTDNVRCSLAFNMVPTVGFGDEDHLTELKF